MSSWRYDAVFDLSKLEELRAKIDNFPTALEDVAGEIRDEVKKNIKSQNIIDTGFYLNSIESGVHSPDTAYVKDGTTYGVYQEFGTRKMAARPHLIPAAEKFGKLISEKFTELMR